ncbi:MAG: hypothetical protein ACRD16_02030 [Thermoanaerobaculia bacterium]
MPGLARLTIETVFTAYVVPALLTPVVWLGTIASRKLHPVGASPEARIARIERAYVALGALLLALGLAAWAGVPVERGGRAMTYAAWAMYVALNLLFAGLVGAMATGYPKLPEGRRRDRLFVRFLVETAFQPIVTAGTFLLLYRLLRVVFHRTIPVLGAVQEGI